MNRRRTVLLLVVALALALAGSACGSDNKVGDESLLNFKEQANNRLGETTTTTAAATTTTAAGKATTTTAGAGAKAGIGATTTTLKAATTTTTAIVTTTTRGQTVREIHIYGDTDPAHEPLEPRDQTAFVGSIIRWINHDTVAHAIRADQGQFASPTIAPGASWDYTVRTAGEFAYSDDTRPYVNGRLLVANR